MCSYIQAVCIKFKATVRVARFSFLFEYVWTILVFFQVCVVMPRVNVRESRNVITLNLGMYSV